MHLLQTVAKHRAVDLLEQFPIDMHDPVRRYADQIAVERSVVDLAQAQPVRHERKPAFAVVLDDVRCVQQFRVPQSADCAAALVRLDYSSAKLWLMKALLNDALRISTFRVVRMERVDDEAQAFI